MVTAEPILDSFVFIGVAVERIFFSDDSDNFHRRPGRNERRVLRVEDLLWGWLLRLELEEDCSALIDLVRDDLRAG